MVIFKGVYIPTLQLYTYHMYAKENGDSFSCHIYNVPRSCFSCLPSFIFILSCILSLLLVAQEKKNRKIAFRLVIGDLYTARARASFVSLRHHIIILDNILWITIYCVYTLSVLYGEYIMNADKQKKIKNKYVLWGSYLRRDDDDSQVQFSNVQNSWPVAFSILLNENIKIYYTCTVF